MEIHSGVFLIGTRLAEPVCNTKMAKAVNYMLLIDMTQWKT